MGSGERSEDGERNALRRRDALRLAATSGAGALLAGCFGEDGGNDGDGGGSGPGGSSDPADDDGPRELVVGTAAEFPPFEQVAAASLVGFDVDLATAAIDATEGYELAEWRYDGLFSSLPGALAEGGVDVLAAALSITEPRQEDLAFTEPYFATRQAVLVAGGDSTPAAIEDLAGATIGAQTATTGEALIETELVEPGLVEPSEYASWDTYPGAVAALEQGTVDAVVVDAPAARSFAADGRSSVAFLAETVERYGIGVRGDDETLRDALDEGLRAVRESGRYDEIAAEWLAGSDGAIDGDESGESNESESGSGDA